MRSHLLRTGAACLAAGAALLLTGTPASAAGVPWSVGHGTATAQGTRGVQQDPGDFLPSLVILGELSNTGDGCSSVWFQFNHDLAPGPAFRHATQCGPGTTPIEFRTAYRPTTTGSAFVCEGTTREKCGERRTVTSWPVQQGVTTD
ncbi:hypothetical protein I3F58_16115 [Streptomyces sp. MUM 203J]|uniref:hypothetical protein n=1 Tax=Streptomyces sp. MUM 203J TaxID=2791990 RepID=UPI001F04732D|nr:hypothetical protein [Streptomyces sp. MUM 203J]MCH0541065.1 hypothetical protein [Streptomyces sp. MUM 203J]